LIEIVGYIWPRPPVNTKVDAQPARDLAGQTEGGKPQSGTLTSVSPKGVEGPRVVSGAVTEDVEVTVVGSNPKTLVFPAVPLVEDFLHVEGARTRCLRREAERPLVGLIPGVTLDLESHLG